MSSGKYLGNLTRPELIQLPPQDMMQTILRQHIQNQMYFEDLTLNSIFRMRSTSRYVFLEFIEAFSLILVGN